MKEKEEKKAGHLEIIDDLGIFDPSTGSGLRVNPSALRQSQEPNNPTNPTNPSTGLSVNSTNPTNSINSINPNNLEVVDDLGIFGEKPEEKSVLRSGTDLALNIVDVANVRKWFSGTQPSDVLPAIPTEELPKWAQEHPKAFKTAAYAYEMAKPSMQAVASIAGGGVGSIGGFGGMLAGSAMGYVGEQGLEQAIDYGLYGIRPEGTLTGQLKKLGKDILVGGMTAGNPVVVKGGKLIPVEEGYDVLGKSYMTGKLSASGIKKTIAESGKEAIEFGKRAGLKYTVGEEVDSLTMQRLEELFSKFVGSESQINKFDKANIKRIHELFDIYSKLPESVSKKAIDRHVLGARIKDKITDLLEKKNDATEASIQEYGTRILRVLGESKSFEDFGTMIKSDLNIKKNILFEMEKQKYKEIGDEINSGGVKYTNAPRFTTIANKLFEEVQKSTVVPLSVKQRLAKYTNSEYQEKILDIVRKDQLLRKIPAVAEESNKIISLEAEKLVKAAGKFIKPGTPLTEKGNVIIQFPGKSVQVGRGLRNTLGDLTGAATKVLPKGVSVIPEDVAQNILKYVKKGKQASLNSKEAQVFFRNITKRNLPEDLKELLTKFYERSKYSWDDLEDIRKFFRDELIDASNISVGKGVSGKGMGASTNTARNINRYYKQVFRAIQLDQKDFIEGVDKSLVKRTRETMRFGARIRSQYKNETIRSLIEAEPYNAVSTFFRPGSVEKVRKVRAAIGEDAFDRTVKPVVVNKLLGVDNLADFNPKKFASNINHYGKETIDAVFGKGQYSNLVKMANEGISLTKLSADDMMEKRFMESIVKTYSPEEIVNNFLNTGSRALKNYPMVYKNMDTTTRLEMKAALLEQLFYKGQKISPSELASGDIKKLLLFDPEQLLKNVNEYMDVMKRALTKEQVGSISMLAGAIRKMSSAKRTIKAELGVGGQLRSAQVGGAAISAYSGNFPVAGLLFFTPGLVARMILSDTGRKLILTGLKIKNNTREAQIFINRANIFGMREYKQKKEIERKYKLKRARMLRSIFSPSD